MRILLLTHAFNSLTQRLHVDLIERGHEVSVELDVHFDVAREGIGLFRPDIVLAPFLKRAVPEDIWSVVPCLIVHPGIPGDRGPSALDWAILERRECWGVTVLQAEAALDAGPVWATAEFPMRTATKSSLYRREVSDAAVRAVFAALGRIEAGLPPLLRMSEGDPRITVRGPCRQQDRKIDWEADSTETILRKIDSADGTPGVVDTIYGEEVRIFDAHPATRLKGPPGTVLAQWEGALARATVDGAIWIGHVKRAAPSSLKLPAAEVFREQALELPAAADCGYGPISYREAGEVGFLHFAFYNGAMSTRQCEMLRAAYHAALARPTRLLMLMGGPDYWSNGIHLAEIEAAASPADESWRNINAIDDLARDIIETGDRLIVSVLRGNAGAGGVFLALAADEVWACANVVLNPHYKDMGNLYGSEYWTYLLPRRAGEDCAKAIMNGRLPMGSAEAKRLRLIDRVIDRPEGDADALGAQIQAMALSLVNAGDHGDRIREKARRRAADEAVKPLQQYRDDELARMKFNFYGFDPSYHVARYNFIHKVPKSRTPLTIARHRARLLNRQPRKTADLRL